MKYLILDIFSYCKAVLIEGRRWIFSLFDILGVVLFFYPKLAQVLLNDTQMIRFIGLIIFQLSFILANFTLFKKLMPQPIDEQSIRLFPHRTKMSNAVMMKYEGQERANNLEVTLKFITKSFETKQIRVKQFFPPNDPEMLFNAGLITFLEPGQIAYFYLLGAEENAGKEVTVSVSFVTSKSLVTMKTERVFPI